MPGPRIALAPPGTRAWLADAIREGGGELVEPAGAEGLVWAEVEQPAQLNDLLQAHLNIRWVQLPFAGVEPYLGVLDHDHVWTSGKGVYAEPVAEHALAFLLAGLRGLGAYARLTHWSKPQGTNLLGAKVALLGGGGITESFLRLVQPFEASVTVVRRRPLPLDGATLVVGPDRLEQALDGAVGVVLALALTPETRGIIGRRQLELLAPRGWLVNVARGPHVVTDDLVAALRDGSIGGAGLDVTDPEPLPEGHPLWSLPNCIITPHVGNTPEMAMPLLSRRIRDNVRRFAAGEPLIGLVDPDLGY
ncbi:MAG: D-isomer specific 2-hydroxyacid dehydrogenase family protein [Acidimicrobiales bacterium]